MLENQELKQGIAHHWGGFSEKKLLFFCILSKIAPPPPLPPIWTNCTTFFNSKNVDLTDIQNDSLFKILLLLKAEYSLCGSCINLKNELMKRCHKIWAGGSPPHLDKIQKNSTFSSGTPPSYNNLLYSFFSFALCAWIEEEWVGIGPLWVTANISVKTMPTLFQVAKK